MAIPKNAKRVFKGIIFDVYQWQQKIYDGSHRTFEKIKRQDTVVVLATTDDKKIIIQKQIQPGYNWFLSSPSGRMDKPGESPRQCALRELLEETGMKPRKIFLWKKFQASRKIEHTVYIFIAQGCKVITKPQLDGAEKIQNLKYGFEKFLKLHDNPQFLGPETQMDMFRAKYDKRFRAQFKGLLFK